MPYPEMPDGRFIRESAEGEPKGFLSQWQIAKLLERKYEGRLIGHGSESIVIPIEGNDEKVAAYYYNRTDPIEAKRIFYLQRIFSTLFPHNFPRFFAAFGNEPESGRGISGTIRQRIEGEEKPSRFEEEKREAYEAKVRFPFQNVIQQCEEMGIEPWLDPFEENYIRGSDGGEYYVDTIPGPSGVEFNAEKILAYMRKEQYADEDILVVEKSLQRLQAIERAAEKR